MSALKCSPFLERPLRSFAEADAEIRRVRAAMKAGTPSRRLKAVLRRHKRLRSVARVLEDQRGFITVEAAVWLTLLIPAAVISANVVLDFLTVFTAALQEHSEILCASLSSPPDACNPN